MITDERERVATPERRRAGAKLVKRGPQTIEVGTVIDRLRRPACEFGRDVGERAGKIASMIGLE